MNKNHLALFNKLRRDALMRNAGDPETLSDYLTRYYGVKVAQIEASALFRALQTSMMKRKKSAKRELVS